MEEAEQMIGMDGADGEDCPFAFNFDERPSRSAIPFPTA